MTKGLQQIQFLCFAIICKRQYINSVVLGSINQISIKIGVTDYQIRKQINYGLKNGLITQNKGGYIFAKYSTIIEHIEAVGNAKHYDFYKEGNYSELVEKNLFIIALNNFKTQQFRAKQTIRLKQLNSLATVPTEVKGQFSKSDYSLYLKNKNRVLGADYIVTGQKHLSKILKVSQGLANKLLNRWAELGLFFRTIIYLSFFDKNEYNYSLNMAIPKICIGSKIVLTS